MSRGEYESAFKPRSWGEGLRGCQGQNRTWENRLSGIVGGLAETSAMVELGTHGTYRKGAGWKLSA
jgi:hypothetical protein